MSFQKYTPTANRRPHSTGTEVTPSQSSLTQLCMEGDLNSLKSRVQQGVDILEADSNGNLLTHTAARYNKLDVLKWLVKEKGMDIHAVNNNRKSILQLAIESQSHDVIEWLLNDREAIRLTVTIDDLCLAINSEDISIVRAVTKAVANVLQKNTSGQTPLQFAQSRRNQSATEYLAKRTFLSILREQTNEEDILKNLMEHFGNQPYGFYDFVIKPAYSADPIINVETEKIPLVIHQAQRRHMKIVKWLVEKGANPNSKLKSGSSLLAEISWTEDPNDFKWLVNKGASIYSKDASGKFAIEKYVREGNLAMIRWAVLDKHLNPLRDNDNKSNLLILSIELGKADILEFLLKNSPININMRLAKKRTLLHLAAWHTQENIVKKLLENKAEIDLEDEDEQTAIDLSINKQNHTITQLLIIAYIVYTIESNELSEDTKIRYLIKFLTRYRKKYTIKKDDAKRLSKDIIERAQQMKLQKLANWLRAHPVLIGGDELKEYNVLIIGETGVGKSTFINAFVNYINFSDLKEAVKSEELYCLIPSSFAITDDNYERHVVTFGTDENESFATGQSSTQSARSYSIVTGDSVLRFIDTPGIGDTRGIERDRENFDKLLKVIAELENIHAICVMLKPNNSRLSVLFEYCVKELFSHLNKSASDNILFLFTNSRGTFYRPGDTLPPLLKILKDLEEPPSNVIIPLNKHNVFCMDNESFRFLLAKKKGVVFSEEEEQDFEASWNKSAQVCRDFVKYLVKLKPHKIQNSVSINAARRLVLSLSKPLAEVAQHAEKTALYLQDKKDAIERNKDNMQELKKNLHLRVPNLKVVELPYPLTGCMNKDCITIHWVSGRGYAIPRECHYPCYHRGIKANVRGHNSLRRCGVIQMWCEICQHSFRDHIHQHYRVQFEEEILKNTALQLQLKDTNLNQEKIRRIIREFEATYQQYRAEEDIILKTVSKFSHFLKHNSIIGFNDFCREYIQDLIAEERKMGQDADLQLISTYTDILQKYDQHFKDLEDEYKRTKNTSIDSSGIFAGMDDLYKMKHFGGTIKKLADVQLSGQMSEVLVDTEIIPRNDTFATFMSSIQSS